MLHLNLLQLRSRQLKRQLSAPGLIYGTLLVLVIFVIMGWLWVQFHDPLRAKVLAGVIVLCILSIHTARKDKVFVLNQLPAPSWQFFYEYSVLSLPVMLPCLISTQWYLVPCMILCFGGIAQLRLSLRQRTAFPYLSRIIPAAQFELLSGFRKNYALFILLYVVAWATSWIIIAPVLALWLLTLSVLGCYMECESYDMLTVAADTPAAFLRKKIGAHYRLLAIITLPVLLVQVIVQPGYWWLALFLAVVQPILLTLGISYKYSHYSPKESLTTGNILLSIIACSSLIPFLLPLPLLFAARYYRSALTNLEYYLHDQHPQP